MICRSTCRAAQPQAGGNGGERESRIRAMTTIVDPFNDLDSGSLFAVRIF